MSIDYTSYSDDVIDETFVEDPIDEVIEEDTQNYDDPTMMGVIYNTKRVYLREQPTKTSPHITVLDCGDDVMIDGTAEDEFGNGWYHLITASGNEGYTMAEYVKIVE